MELWGVPMWRRVCEAAFATLAGVVFVPGAVDAMRPSTNYVHVGTTTTWSTIHAQIELYRYQHDGARPDLLLGWRQLVEETSAAGGVPHGDEPAYGPYFEEPPLNRITRSSDVVRVEDARPGVGWLYDPESHALWFVVPPEYAATHGLRSWDPEWAVYRVVYPTSRVGTE